MKNTFVVLWRPGPAWVQGKTVREQPYWEAESEQELADLIAQDPFVTHGIFALGLLKQWTLFLDARRKA